ncbi:MAG: DMT family transporter [Pyrinomonadaceae bacterium]
MRQSLIESKYTPYLSLLAVQALFGSLPVIGKTVLVVLPSLALVGFRVGITTVLLVIIQAFRGRFWLKEPGDYLQLAVLSLFGITFNQIFFISGVSLTKASNASLLAATIPIFTLAISIIKGVESPRLGKLVGIFLAAAGVLFLIDPRNASFSSETTLGDISIVINSLSFAIYVATSKAIVTRNGAFRSMMWVFLFASLICVPAGIITLSTIEISAIDRTTWWLIIYICIGATAIPYLLNAWALTRVSPSTLAVFIYLQPIIGFVLAAILLGESFDLRFVAATAMIFAGLFLSMRNGASFGKVNNDQY